MKTNHNAIAGLILGLLLSLASNARAFYNPQTGRWLTRDPIAEGAGFVQREPKSEPSFLHIQRTEANSYGFVRNDVVNQYDVLGLLTFFKNECQGCNGNWWYMVEHGANTCKHNAAGTYVPGASGSFSHSCDLQSGGPALCNTETHIYIKAVNEDGCCTKWYVTCNYSYQGSITVPGSGNGWIDARRFAFLGQPVAPVDALVQYPPPSSISLAQGGSRFGVVDIPKGKSVVVFELQPRNSFTGSPGSISESGEVSCTAKCAWDLKW